jgi:uncharacterized protein YjiK
VSIGVALGVLCLVGPAEGALGLLAHRPVSVGLPGALREVSGLVFQGADTLWAHDDERAVVIALDPATGEVLTRRVLGPRPVLGDFEGITWDGRHLHLVTSSGTLVSFAPGREERVDAYGVRETAAGSWCEVEGLALDPERNTLVMACKTLRMEGLEAGILLLETDLPPGPTAAVGVPLPVRVALAVPSEVLRAAGLPARLALSDIEYDPGRDTWLLVAARQRWVVETSRAGDILGKARLPSGRHPQAEGLALSPDRQTLYVADEGGRARGRLHLYRADQGDPPR